MEFIGLSWQAWFTLVVIFAMFASLLFTKIHTEVAFLATIAALYLSGVLDVNGAFGGFSSESVLVVAVLYVVIAGLTYTGVLNWIVKNLLGQPRTLTGAILHLMLPVAMISSLLSNTTVVALFINVVKMWSRKLNIAPSKLLIPLSYASGMGGICTLIGTPPNIIISGLYSESTGIKLSLLTPTICGLFCLAVGVLSMVAMRKLLPNRISPMHSSDNEDFTVELKVTRHNPYIGKTISELINESGYSANDIHLVAIRRFDSEIVNPVLPDEFIMGGDRLIVNGKPKGILKASISYGMISPQLRSVLESESSVGIKPSKTLISSLILLLMIVLSSLKIMSLLSCCLIAAIAMILFGCCTSSQGIKSIDWNILIIFAGSVAIGKAIEQTGLAQLMASALLDIGGSNPYIVLTMMCLFATSLTEFVSNTAAGAMFFPISMSLASSLNVNPLTFCVALMISASSSYATPIGSPTHMLVYSPGGYRFEDFAKVGLVMNLIILIANVFITTLVFPF